MRFCFALGTGVAPLFPKGDPVTSMYKILIADRNRHVRDFLRRELTAEGYRVEMAADGQEILRRIDGADRPHLLILDLEIPYLDDAVWGRLQDCQPPLPLVIHTLLPQHPTNQTFPFAAAFLEKAGDTDRLKTVVAEVIAKYYPQGLTAREGRG
jgi:CheY-like chemotaxis protein